MAYKFTRDGETVIRFERGKWDSFWGYQCPGCYVIITESSAAHDHENACAALAAKGVAAARPGAGESA